MTPRLSSAEQTARDRASCPGCGRGIVARRQDGTRPMHRVDDKNPVRSWCDSSGRDE